MEYTRIPNLVPNISRIGLGTWAMGGSLWGASDERESIDAILHALESGINFIDTAPGYGFGVSEEVVGKAIRRYGRREDVILATKFGLNLRDPYNVYRDARKEAILHEIEGSLQRLGVDYIDLYQVHWPDTETPQEETASVLNDLLNQGIIRSIGVSNYTVEQAEKFKKIAPVHCIQIPFNIFEREIEDTIPAFCRDQKIATIGYSSLCRGLLTGTLREDHDFEDLRKNFDPKFRKPHFAQYLICVGRLEQWVHDKYGRPLVALAIRWSLDKGIDIALWGARKPEELNPIKDILGWKLTEQDFNEIDHIVSETVKDPIGPQFMSPPLRKTE